MCVGIVRKNLVMGSETVDILMTIMTTRFTVLILHLAVFGRLFLAVHVLANRVLIVGYL